MSRMEERKNLVQTFMATHPVLAEAAQDDLSQVDNSYSARARRLMDGSYGNQNPHEIEKARQAEAESRQRSAIQEHAARTFYTLNWERQMATFGGVHMTNAEKLELIEDMAANADTVIDEAIEAGEVQESQRQSTRSKLHERRDLARKARALGGEENLSAEDRAKYERLNTELKGFDKRHAERHEYKKLKEAAREHGGIDQLSQEERVRLQELEQKIRERQERGTPRREHNQPKDKTQNKGPDQDQPADDLDQPADDLDQPADNNDGKWKRWHSGEGLIYDRGIVTPHDLCKSFTSAAAPENTAPQDIRIDNESKLRALPQAAAPTTNTLTVNLG